MTIAPRLNSERNSAFQAAIEEARALPLEAALAGHRLKRVTPNELAGACPVCGGLDRFGVNLRKRIWKCREGDKKKRGSGCGAGGNDAISLAMHVNAIDFLAAVELLTGARRYPSQDAPARSCPRPQPRIVDQARDDAKDAARSKRHLDHARRIVAEMVPIAGTPGETYLREIRGIDTVAIADVLTLSDAIGWHPEVYFGQPDPSEPFHALNGHKIWCIVAVMTDPVTALPTGAISRTYLDPSTGRKIGKAKSLGTPAGIVRLTPDEDVATGLHLAEGLETALAAMAIGLRPIWSTGTTSLLKAFPVLPGVECLTVLADHDHNGAGEHAAGIAVRRWRDARREARILRRRDPGDLNDAVMSTMRQAS
jgi:hypothetical protein